MQTQQQIRELILKELPALLQQDNTFRESVLEIARPLFADKVETAHLFDEIIVRFDRSIC